MTRPLQTKAGEGERLSRDLSRSAGGPLPVANHAPAPVLTSVACDLCGWNMPLPTHCIEQGAVLGLLTCSQCAEDELQSRIFQ